MGRSPLDETLDRLFVRELGFKTPVELPKIRKRRKERSFPLDEDDAKRAEELGREVITPEQFSDALCEVDELANLATD